MTDRSHRVTPKQFDIRMATRSALVLASLLIAPFESRAQLADSARLAVGTRIWLRTHDGEQGASRFERASPDSLTLRRRVNGGEVMRTIPWSDAERVDTMVAGRPSLRRVFVGSVIGGLAGLAVAYIGATAGQCHAELSCSSVGFAILAPEIVGTGALIGGAAGFFHRDGHWSTVWRARIPADG